MTVDTRTLLAAGQLTARTLSRREFKARLVTAGIPLLSDKRPANMLLPAKVLETAAQLGAFDAKAVFLDHAGWFDYPSMANLIAVTADTHWNDTTLAVEGLLRFYDTTLANEALSLVDAILQDQVDGAETPDIGLSLSLYPIWAEREKPSDPLTLKAIRHVESVDLVFQPATDSRITTALSALNLLAQETATMTELIVSPLAADSQPAPGAYPGSTTPLAPAAATPDPWALAIAATASRTLIAATDLPAAAKARLQVSTYVTPEAVEAAIANERTYLAALTAASVVQLGGPPPRSPGITGMRSSMDQLDEALTALVLGQRPEHAHPLSGLREFYLALSGDYEMSGMFHPDRVMLANVTSATMASMVANVLNKVVVTEFQLYPHWWESFTRREGFSTLQTVRWIVLGGVGELPTVAEGAAYTELTWDDKYESATWVKKGGYLGLTLEAMDADDVGRLRSAPRALAQAAYLTLGKAVSTVFTSASGLGPTLIDTGTLFNATAVSSTGGHANLGTAALSSASWTAAKLAMRKQVEVNSGERLGVLTSPRFLLVPPDLENTALTVLASENMPGTANNDLNPDAEGSTRDARVAAAQRRIVVVDLWTDTNNWVATADPNLYPTVGLGFRFGEAPEIFSVASPTAGLMFSNDVMPVKVRWFYACGPMDFRGLYKANVA